MQISRFTSSKPSKSAFASDEKSIRRPTASFVRYRLNKPVNGDASAPPRAALCSFCSGNGTFAAKSRPASSYTLDTFENSRGFAPFERFKGFFGSLSWRSRVSCCYGPASPKYSVMNRIIGFIAEIRKGNAGPFHAFAARRRTNGSPRCFAVHPGVLRRAGFCAKNRRAMKTHGAPAEGGKERIYLMYLSMISCMAPSEIISSSALSIFSSSSVFSLDMHSA